MRIISLLLTILMAGMMYMAASGFPIVGDETAPAAEHVSPRYIEEGYEETHSPNLVTAVLADYRSFDTLGETLVIFTAGAATVLILRAESRKKLGGGDKE